MDVYGHTVLHNDPIVAAEMRLVKNATSSIRGSKRAATPMMTGDGPRCTAVTKKGTRCRNASTNFGDSKLCYIHSRQAMGQSEMADIRGYRAENPASGPGMSSKSKRGEASNKSKEGRTDGRGEKDPAPATPCPAPPPSRQMGYGGRGPH